MVPSPTGGTLGFINEQFFLEKIPILKVFISLKNKLRVDKLNIL